MDRRDFLAASALAVAAGMSQEACAGEEAGGGKQYLELRHYEFGSGEKQKVFEDFLGEAAIPALNRLGVRPVGVFKDVTDKDGVGLWVLLPHDTLESVITCNTKMLGDGKFKSAGGVVLNSPMKDPVYKRFTSSLLLGFDKCPKVEVPSKKDSRLFQLRIYESHNAIMAKRKVEMFNTGGEIDLFRVAGLKPVFFGESIIGAKMANLTYMVGFDDIESKDKAWDAFINHPKWKKISSDPYYKDTVSNITNLVLRPSTSSQI